MNRRNVLLGGSAAVLTIGGGLLVWRQSGDVPEGSFEITKSE